MKEKVNVTGVPETMVQTLYARAKETRKKNAKINDEIAVELVKKLDYDFSKADKDNAMTYGVIARTIVLDQMVKQYLEKNANTVVINIACGLDTRCYRNHTISHSVIFIRFGKVIIKLFHKFYCNFVIYFSIFLSRFFFSCLFMFFMLYSFSTSEFTSVFCVSHLL